MRLRRRENSCPFLISYGGSLIKSFIVIFLPLGVGAEAVALPGKENQNRVTMDDLSELLSNGEILSIEKQVSL